MIEDWAYLPSGHFPRRFAELAEAFTGLGWHAKVLTSRGWLHVTDTETAPFAVSRYGFLAGVFDRVANRLREVYRETRAGTMARTIGPMLRVMAIIGAARSLCRRSAGAPTVVVVLSYGIDIVLAAAIAGPGRWLFYAFEPPPAALGKHQIRLESGIAKWAERRRRAQGGGARIASPDNDCRQQWAEIAAFLEPTVLPIAGCRVSSPIPDARQQLDLSPVDRIALMFGSSNVKDCEVVCQTFSVLEDWRLLICGVVADQYNAANQPLAVHQPILMGGFVSDATRDLVYAAADLAILSFRSDYQRNSGTLMDAIAWGIPVVCSERSAAAELVEKYRLGVTFSPGDMESLASAVRRAPDHIEEEDLQRARNDLSNAAVATRYLELLKRIGDTK